MSIHLSTSGDAHVETTIRRAFPQDNHEVNGSAKVERMEAKAYRVVVEWATRPGVIIGEVSTAEKDESARVFARIREAIESCDANVI